MGSDGLGHKFNRRELGTNTYPTRAFPPPGVSFDEQQSFAVRFGSINYLHALNTLIIFSHHHFPGNPCSLGGASLFPEHFLFAG